MMACTGEGRSSAQRALTARAVKAMDSVSLPRLSWCRRGPSLLRPSWHVTRLSAVGTDANATTVANTYIVQSGESLADIAAKHNVSVRSIKELNYGHRSILKGTAVAPGSKLQIPAREGQVVMTVAAQTLPAVPAAVAPAWLLQAAGLGLLAAGAWAMLTQSQSTTAQEDSLSLQTAAASSQAEVSLAAAAAAGVSRTSAAAAAADDTTQQSHTAVRELLMDARIEIMRAEQHLSKVVEVRAALKHRQLGVSNAVPLSTDLSSARRVPAAVPAAVLVGAVNGPPAAAAPPSSTSLEGVVESLNRAWSRDGRVHEGDDAGVGVGAGAGGPPIDGSGATQANEVVQDEYDDEEEEEQEVTAELTAADASSASDVLAVSEPFTQEVSSIPDAEVTEADAALLIEDAAVAEAKVAVLDAPVEEVAPPAPTGTVTPKDASVVEAVSAAAVAEEAAVAAAEAINALASTVTNAVNTVSEATSVAAGAIAQAVKAAVPGAVEPKTEDSVAVAVGAVEALAVALDTAVPAVAEATQSAADAVAAGAGAVPGAVVETMNAAAMTPLAAALGLGAASTAAAPAPAPARAQSPTPQRSAPPRSPSPNPSTTKEQLTLATIPPQQRFSRWVFSGSSPSREPTPETARAPKHPSKHPPKEPQRLPSPPRPVALLESNPWFTVDFDDLSISDDEEVDTAKAHASPAYADGEPVEAPPVQGKVIAAELTIPGPVRTTPTAARAPASASQALEGEEDENMEAPPEGTQPIKSKARTQPAASKVTPIPKYAEDEHVEAPPTGKTAKRRISIPVPYRAKTPPAAASATPKAEEKEHVEAPPYGTRPIKSKVASPAPTTPVNKDNAASPPPLPPSSTAAAAVAAAVAMAAARAPLPASAAPVPAHAVPPSVQQNLKPTAVPAPAAPAPKLGTTQAALATAPAAPAQAAQAQKVEDVANVEQELPGEADIIQSSAPLPSTDPSPSPRALDTIPETVYGLKAALMDFVYASERGAIASSEQHGRAEELITALECRNPNSRPLQSLAALHGRWKLVYTSSQTTGLLLSTLANLPLMEVGDVYQQIDTNTMTAYNKIDIKVPMLVTLRADTEMQVRTPALLKVRLARVGVDTFIQTPQLLTALDLPPALDLWGTKLDLTPVRRYIIDPLNAVFETSKALVNKAVAPEIELQATENTSSWMLTTFLDETMRVTRDDSGAVYVMLKDVPEEDLEATTEL